MLTSQLVESDQTSRHHCTDDLSGLHGRFEECNDGLSAELDGSARADKVHRIVVDVFVVDEDVMIIVRSLHCLREDHLQLCK